MLRRVPIAGSPVELRDLAGALFGKEDSLSFGGSFGNGDIFFADSATSSIYMALEAMKNIRAGEEVILPAYTASSILIAVRAAGLRPVLCDISLEDFNIDYGLLEEQVNSKTLAVIFVHLFGIVSNRISRFKEQFPKIFVIEDCAQAMGGTINGQVVGGFGDIGVYSFNRGKNISTYRGGCSAVNNPVLTDEVCRVSGQYMHKRSTSGRLSVVLKNFLLSLVVRPEIYGLVCPLLKAAHERAPDEEVEVFNYTGYQKRLLSRILKNIESFSEIRYNNGMKLIHCLEACDKVELPVIAHGTRPSFNRLPVVFKDVEVMERVMRRLENAGIHSSRMYYETLHRSPLMAGEEGECQAASCLAGHLLTLPVHPLVAEQDLEIIINTIINY